MRGGIRISPVYIFRIPVDREKRNREIVILIK